MMVGTGLGSRLGDNVGRRVGAMEGVDVGTREGSNVGDALKMSREKFAVDSPRPEGDAVRLTDIERYMQGGSSPLKLPRK